MEPVESEISEMLDTFEGKVKDSSEEREEVVEEKEEVKEEIEEKEVKEEVKDEEEKGKKEEKEVVLDEKDQIIADLRKQLEEKSSEKKEEVKEEVKETPIKLEDQDFVGDIDLDELTRDKTSLNKLLNNVYSRGVIDSKSLISDAVLKALPEIVKNNVSIVNTLKETSDKFYAENEDLVPFKKVVAAVFEEVAAKNPNKRYDEILNDVSKEARKQLNLKLVVKKDDTPPKLPSKGNGKRTEPNKSNVSQMESELSAMNETLTRR